MTIKKSNIFYLLAFIALLAAMLYVAFVPSSSPTKKLANKGRKYTSKAENNKCLKCHGNAWYETTNLKDSTQTALRKMPKDYIIDTANYYMSAHPDFKCYDCHSDQYAVYPHNPELKFNEMPNCIDCHADDPKYKFEMIDLEYQKSVHSKRLDKKFNCWTCHNPHSYKVMTRDSMNKVTEIADYNNKICLNCHKPDGEKFIKAHSWLPNQETHFAKLRCIDCHASANDSILVAHNVEPVKYAKKDCAKCHASNTVLNKTLYKNRKASHDLGFDNSVIVKDSYISGANSNKYLVAGGFIILGLTVFGLLANIYYRINKKHKHHGKK